MYLVLSSVNGLLDSTLASGQVESPLIKYTLMLLDQAFQLYNGRMLR